MVNREILKLLKGNKADILGLLISSNVFYGWILIVCLPIAAAYLRIDSQYYLIKDCL